MSVTSVPAIACQRAPSARSLSQALGCLFASLDEFGITYCVLNGYGRLPHAVETDLDIAVSRRDAAKVGFVLGRLEQLGYLPVHCCEYAVDGYRFDLVWSDEDNNLQFLAIDLIFDFRLKGLLLCRGEHLLEDRVRSGNFWMASPERRFRYLLAKRIAKVKVNECQADELRNLALTLGAAAVYTASRDIVGARAADGIFADCVNGLHSQRTASLRRFLWQTRRRREPLRVLWSLARESARIFRRWLNPPGTTIVLLGPDGVGKSTIAREAIRAWTNAFRNGRIFHWRYGLVRTPRKQGQAVTNPHGKAPHGYLVSIGALLTIWLDYICGYWLVLRSLAARDSVVVFDRYYHDLLVDPLRYRYGGPKELLSWLSGWLPGRGLLYILLEAPTEILLRRKTELSAEELVRQAEAYRSVASRYGATTVDASSDSQSTSQALNRALLNSLNSRFRVQAPDWAKPSFESVL